MRASSLASCFCLAFVLLSNIAAAQFVEKTASASVGDLSTEVSLASVYHSDWTPQNASVRVYSPKGTIKVPCLNPYRDFQYRLTDASGKTVAPADMSHAGWGPEIHAASFINPCHTLSQLGDYVIQLSGLYPKLPPGTYMLRVTFAPVTKQGLPYISLPPITFEESASSGAPG